MVSNHLADYEINEEYELYQPVFYKVRVEHFIRRAKTVPFRIVGEVDTDLNQALAKKMLEKEFNLKVK